MYEYKKDRLGKHWEFIKYSVFIKIWYKSQILQEQENRPQPFLEPI